MKTGILPGLLLLLSSIAYSQTTGQLLTQLKTTQYDTTRLRLYSELSETYQERYHYDSVFFFAQKLLPLASRLHSIDYAGMANYYLGFYYRDKKDPAKSNDFFQKAIRLLQQVRQPDRIAHAQFLLARIHSVREEYKQALPLARASLSYYESRNDPEFILKLSVELAQLYYMVDQYDSLYVTAQKQLLLASKIHSVRYLGFAHLYLGYYDQAKGLNNQAIEQLKQALRLHQQDGIPREIALRHFALGSAYGVNADKKKSITHLLAGLNYFESHAEMVRTLNTYLMLVANYRGLNEQMRVFYTDKYMQLVTTSDDWYTKANANKLKAEIYEDQNQYDQALPYRIQALKLVRKTQIPLYLIDALYWTAAALRNANRSAEALPYLQEAFSLANRLKSTYWQCYVGQEMAKNFAKLNQHQKALEAANQALAIARQFNNSYDLSTAFSTLTTVQEAAGQHQQALVTYKKYHAAKDSTYSVERAKQIAKIQSQYDLEKKEATILLLNKNAQLQKLKTQQQQKELTMASQQRLFLILGIGTLAVTLVVVGFFLRQSTRQKRQIETQAEKLKESNAQKDHLFAIIGHDLRSPVASIKSSLMLMRMTNEPIEHLDELENQVNGLHNTMDNLLYWSLNQRNGLRVVPRSVKLSDLVEDTLDGFEGLIRYKNLIVTTDMTEVMVTMDQNLAVLVLRNMLHNAFKFTPEGGAVRVSIQQQSTQINLIIADTGIGMDTSQLHQKPTGERGTGLGLQVSRDLMVLNGGELAIESQLGKGTTVTLSWS